MNHELSPDDRRFRADFEAGTITPAEFDHRAHVHLAYTYLAENDIEASVALMRTALLSFLAHHNVGASKYHETMTRAWTLAVRHFMMISPPAPSADVFIENNPDLMNSRIMLTHYSADLLFSEDARARFTAPDLEGIPEYGP